MLTVSLILVLAALFVAIAAAMGKAPLWVAVVLIAIVQALQFLPVN
jgi:hypothetical protein